MGDAGVGEDGRSELDLGFTSFDDLQPQAEPEGAGFEDLSAAAVIGADGTEGIEAIATPESTPPNVADPNVEKKQAVKRKARRRSLLSEEENNPVYRRSILGR